MAAALSQATGRYLLGPKIGAGGFGEVFVASDAVTGGKVAVKLEPASSPAKCLAREVEAYTQLGAWPSQETERFPALLWYGTQGDARVVVMELLGPSLQNLFQFCGCRFSLKTTLSLADQMLDAVEKVHAAGLVHRDLKPGNFCIGSGAKSNTVQLIDFGLVGRWQHPRTKEHVWYRKTNGWTGTPPYLSLNAHCRVDQTRRDDLESLGYIMIHLLQGSLPWLKLRAEGLKALHRVIMYQKYSTSVESLCQDLPGEFATYLSYCRSLAFSDQPDYSYVRSLFQGLYLRSGFCADSVYDWTAALIADASPGGHPGLVDAGSKHGAGATNSTRETPGRSMTAPDCSGLTWNTDVWDDSSL